MPEDPDRALVEQARSARPGDLRAFEEVVAKYQRRLIANCRHLTGQSNSADDLAQEIFVKVYFGLRGYQGRSSFQHWLHAIKIRHCLSFLKKERPRQFVGIDDESASVATKLATSPEAERILDEDSDRELVNLVLEQMSETLRIPLVLCDMDELTYEEIAETLRIGLSAVKMRVARGRQEFRERYRTMVGQQGKARSAHASR